MDNAIQYIGLSELIPGEFHPHLEYTNDNLDNLTNSIKKYGILEPLIVRPKEQKYEIILGNRRYNAAKNLGLQKVPAIILNVNDETALNIIISDNIQRKELSSKEEAYLYDKVLSFPNTNKEKISINLGIPLDRITSKLNLLQKTKTEQSKEILQHNNQANYNEQNNSVNNDIINLSELNKKEKEREDFNMNNNQFVTNDMNNNMNNQTPTNQPQQEPTFGGRFFPSMEDEPTNMNLNTNIDSNISQAQFANNLTNSPLIDLTDLSPEQPNQQLNNLPNEFELNNNQLTINNQETPQFNLDQFQTNNQNNPIDNQQMMNNPSMINNSQITNPELTIPTGSVIEEPINMNQNMPQELYNQNNSNIPNIVDNQANINQQMPNINEQINNIPDISVSQPQIPTPDLTIPTESVIESQSTSQPINMPNIGAQNINQNYNNVNNPIDINSTVPSPASQKDVIPVVNMLKNLAISIESLGYKLNINEEDGNESYKITIEVEK